MSNQFGHDDFDMLTNRQLADWYNERVPEEEKVTRFSDRSTALRRCRALAEGGDSTEEAPEEKEESPVGQYPEGSLVAELAAASAEDKPREAVVPGSRTSVKRNGKIARRVKINPEDKWSAKVREASLRGSILKVIREAGADGLLYEEIDAKVGFNCRGHVQKLIFTNHVTMTYEEKASTEPSPQMTEVAE